MGCRNDSAGAVLLACTMATGASAQGTAKDLPVTPHFAMPESALTIRQPALPNHPFTVTGRSGAMLGMQDGSVELWQLPTKFFRDLHLRAEVQGYTVPIELNPLAEQLNVSPDHSTIVYSHAAVTVRQHMFVPAGEGNEGLGGMIVFEVEAIRPVTLTISLTPEMVNEWPAPQWGQPSWDWQAMGTGGAYVVGTDNPTVFGMIGMPGATQGEVSPYQERPRTLPLELRLHYDPARDKGRLYPLLCELGRPGERNDEAGVAALKQRMAATAAALPEIYRRTQAYYARFFDTRTVVHTPDPAFDKALAWAELAIDKAQVTTTGGETGLVAGWYPAFDSARPGFGWFFGRDTLWSLYAIDSYGDEALSKRALEFLIRRQRADGKVMHEFSQTADSLTGDMAWSKLPYEYAAADGTPLFLLAVQDYVRTTGDMSFLKAHWDAVQRAYAFESTHDSDGDGVYDNSQGTGWVEGWPPTMPHQELYLAALDAHASSAMAQLATWMGDAAAADAARVRARKVKLAVDAYRLPDGTFAFSKNVDGSYDHTQTVYPAAALWGTRDGLPQPGLMLSHWASSGFSTDWGTRAVEQSDPIYDPISYHQGSVWPLFTGWTSMAEYRNDRPLEGYAALRRNVDLTWAQDPGSVTEVISGRFYQPLERSSTHQLWSSAMVLAPALRGLFGLGVDAPRRTLTLYPQLPPAWEGATLDHVRVGDSEFNLSLKRVGGRLELEAVSEKPAVLCLRVEAGMISAGQGGAVCNTAPATVHRTSLPLPGAELWLAGQALPEWGAESRQPRVIDESHDAHSAALTVEALAGSTVVLSVRRNGAHALRVEGGELNGETVSVTMPPGSDYATAKVAVNW